MGIQVQRTSALRNEFATVLIYAPARWGKTYLARTAKNPLIIATEIGHTSGLTTLSDLDLPFVKVETDQDLSEITSQLKRKKGEVSYGNEVFTSVIVDSLTGCGDLWTEAGKKMLGWEMAFDLRPGKDPRRMYSYIAEKGRQRMKMFFDLECDIAFLCREGLAQEGEGETAITYAVPELPGQKLPKELPGWPDASLHGVLVNGQRFFDTRNKGKVVSGFRVAPNVPLPERILPNLDAIFRLIRGDKTALEVLTPTKTTNVAQGTR